MIDIKLVREKPGLVKDNIKKKFMSDRLHLVDKVKKLDEEWRKLKYKGDALRSGRNKISQEINQAKKQKKDAKVLIKKAKKIPKKIATNNGKTKKLEIKINKLMQDIPNIILPGVPIAKEEKDAKVIKKVGKPKKFAFKPKDHAVLGEKLKALDFVRSAKISGKGFYILKGNLALLNQALIRYAIDFMQKKGYVYIEPPLMLRKKVLGAALDLEEFEKTIYEIKDEDLSLIGTSEHALLGLHANELFTEKELPKKYCSYTMCFRKEIGAHGINERGLFRTHQFNKVEQFVFCKPEDSEKYYKEMLENSIELFQNLKIPTRVVEMPSGKLGTWRAKYTDLETWRPTTKTYEEVGSISNCTDFQARNLNIKVQLRNGEKTVVHTLNNTVIATSRALIAIMENNQQKDGSIAIPKVLQKYMNGKKLIKKN